MVKFKVDFIYKITYRKGGNARYHRRESPIFLNDGGAELLVVVFRRISGVFSSDGAWKF